MTLEQAKNVKIGDTVIYRGRRYTVASVRVKGIAGPYFRLNGLSDDQPDSGGMVSHELVSIPS